MRRLKEKLRPKTSELLVIAVLLLINLRVLNWFEYPNIVVGGDLRPPFVIDAFLKRVLYTWNEVDFGVPSVYSPRILDPFYFFITVFQTLGASAYVSEMMTVFLMYFFSSILMYVFAKQLTSGDITASFIAALYLILNVYLINDREVTAIGFIDLTLMILPCLIAFFRGLEARSYRWMAISGILAILTQTTFPNYRTILICLIMICIVLLFFSLGKKVHVRVESGHISLNISLPHRLLGLLAIFGVAFILVSIWIIVITFSNISTLTAAYAQMISPWFVGGRPLYDVTRLIVRWGFYDGGLGLPYLPYANVYLSNPLMVFSCYLPALIAFASLFLSKERRITTFFGSVAIVSIVLTSGFSFTEYGASFYSDLMELAFLRVFREASNWVFLVVISFGILMGCTVSALCQSLKKSVSKILVLGLIIVPLLFTTYPLMTGDVTRNWLNLNMKGSHLPSSYLELNDALPTKYWSIMLPQKTTYVVYNFTTGNFSCGNPYPLIFSRPVVPGTGTEYIQAGNMDLINQLNFWILNSRYENLAPKGIASASSVEKSELEPGKAVDESYLTRWASGKGFPQWLEVEWNRTQELSGIKIVFEAANATDYIIETWNGSSWAIQMFVENNTSGLGNHIFPQLVPTEKLRVYFIKGNPRFDLVSVWELEIYAQTETVSKFMGILGIKNLILEKKIISGILYSFDEYRLGEYKKFSLIHEWEEVALYENAYAKEKLYPADNALLFFDLFTLYQIVRDSDWSTLEHSAFINAVSPDAVSASLYTNLTMPENFEWKETSPTSYRAIMESKGRFFFVLLESYDEHWKMQVNGTPIPEESHIKVNGFANGWLLNVTGNVVITVEYETQSLLTISIAASVTLPILMLVILSGKDIKRVAHTIRCRFEKSSAS